MILVQRKIDQWGSGSFMADRGDRLHQGVDLKWDYEAAVPAFVDGLVTRIGYPYDPNGDKGHCRYVEISDCGGVLSRYFYVDPIVEVGYMLRAGDVIGSCQDLTRIYPGITNHIHFEALLFVNRQKVYLNPMQYLKALGCELDGH